ncbi:MAG: MurT ligase domain-containing protein [Solirubrobacterales bacterium]
MESVSRLKLGVAKGVGAASRVSGRGGGTSLPGKVLLRLQPDAIERLSSGLERGSVVISATNGKTTTASLLASVLTRSKISVVHNKAGANMAGGIATSLLEASRAGRVDQQLGLFEVDEAWTARIVEEVQPRVLVLANLFRDQLDRYGELETLADSWQEMIARLPASTRVVLNADDPLLAGLGRGRENTVYFGLEDRSQAEEQPRHAADSKFCRICGAPLEYEAVQLGHLGIYRCPNGDFQRPTPQVSATAITSHGMDGSEITISTPDGEIQAELPIPGLYNVYNAVAATAAALSLDLTPGAIAGGLAQARAVFGRVETLQIAGQSVAILLIKNPTGANEVLRTIAEESPPFDIWIALNDKIADGRDISWVWDADFEMLAGNVRKVTCSGTRAEEMALRLAYAGVERSRIEIDGAIERSFDAAVASSVGAAVPIFALPTYTALLELRTAIAKRGDAPTYWGG